jgi:hypothetical protein
MTYEGCCAARPVCVQLVSTRSIYLVRHDHWTVAERLGGFFAQVRLNLPKRKNGSGDVSSQAAGSKELFGCGGGSEPPTFGL